MEIGKKALVVLGLAFVLAGCSSSPSGELITQQQYGQDWPFSVSKGYLNCYSYGAGKNVVLQSGGVVYALNGTARGNANERGYVDSRNAIILKDANGFYTVGNLHKIIKRGLALCK